VGARLRIVSDGRIYSFGSFVIVYWRYSRAWTVPAGFGVSKGPDAGARASAAATHRRRARLSEGYRVCGKPRSTLLVAGSGQRLVTAFVRV
jgi:hypothetical protein